MSTDETTTTTATATNGTTTNNKSINGYPIGSRIILQNLIGGKQYNGSIGIIQSTPNPENGRQQVKLTNDDDDNTTNNSTSNNNSNPGKVLSIQQKNMRWEPRSISSLSLSECKAILYEKDPSILEKTTKNQKQKKEEDDDLDVTVWRSIVEEHIESEIEIASLLATFQQKQRTTTTTSTSTTKKASHMKQQIQNMTPDQLLQQASILRNSNPNILRQSNPAFRYFSDAQIQMAAQQMEQMANNPTQFQGMMKQMTSMKDGDLENMRKGMVNGTIDLDPSTTSSSSSTSTTGGTGAGINAGGNVSKNLSDQMKKGIQSMSQLSPEQLLNQTTMLKRMDKQTLRKMNPAWARMTDEQIDMSIQQMEYMSQNPTMMKQMKESIQNMKSEDLEKIRDMALNGNMMGTGTGAGAGAGAGMMSGKSAGNQMKEMLKVMKDNPAMVKNMLKQHQSNTRGSSNDNNDDNDNNDGEGEGEGEGDTLTDEQIQQTLEMFDKFNESPHMGGILMKLYEYYRSYGKIGILLGVFLFCMMVMIVCFGFYSLSLASSSLLTGKTTWFGGVSSGGLSKSIGKDEQEF